MSSPHVGPLTTFTAMMIATGDRLSLFRTLSEAPAPMSTAELASAAGLTAAGSERWVREWCYQQTAAQLLRHDGAGRFTLSPAVAEVLVDAEGRHGEIGLFPAVQAMARKAREENAELAARLEALVQGK